MIYQTTQDFPDDEKFGLISQQRRAAVSVASNIVEGFRRKSNKDSLHFYNISQGSLEELKYQLLLSKDLQLITEDKFQRILNLADEVGKLLYRWVESNKMKSDF